MYNRVYTTLRLKPANDAPVLVVERNAKDVCQGDKDAVTAWRWTLPQPMSAAELEIIMDTSNDTLMSWILDGFFTDGTLRLLDGANQVVLEEPQATFVNGRCRVIPSLQRVPEYRPVVWSASAGCITSRACTRAVVCVPGRDHHDQETTDGGVTARLWRPLGSPWLNLRNSIITSTVPKNADTDTSADAAAMMMTYDANVRGVRAMYPIAIGLETAGSVLHRPVFFVVQLPRLTNECVFAGAIDMKEPKYNGLFVGCTPDGTPTRTSGLP